MTESVPLEPLRIGLLGAARISPESIIGPAGGIARLNTVAKAPLPDRSVLRIRLSSRIRSGPRRPANVSARQAMRNATPRAASSGPWPATSPIITCTVRSGVWTKS